jgi:hypothetical protein
LPETIYAQRNYGGTRLGTCDGIDRGLYGCAVSTAAMQLTHWAGPGAGAHPDWQVDPGQLDEILTLRAIRGEPGGYVDGCDFYPGLLHDLHPEVLFEGRLDYGGVPADLDRLIHVDDYEREQTIELDGYFLGLGYPTHYAREWSWDGATLKIANPWTGQLEVYDAAWARRAITGIETYRLPGFRPAWAPQPPAPAPSPAPAPVPPIQPITFMPTALLDLVPWETSPTFAPASDYAALRAMGYRAVAVRAANGDGTGEHDQQFVDAWRERSARALAAGVIPMPWTYWYGASEGVTGDVAAYLDRCAHYTARVDVGDAPCWLVDAEARELPGLGEALATLGALTQRPVILTCPGDPVTYGLRWQWGPIVAAVAALAPQLYTADWGALMTVERALQELQAVGATAPLLPLLDDLGQVAAASGQRRGAGFWCVSCVGADVLRAARRAWLPAAPSRRGNSSMDSLMRGTVTHAFYVNDLGDLYHKWYDRAKPAATAPPWYNERLAGDLDPYGGLSAMIDDAGRINVFCRKRDGWMLHVWEDDQGVLHPETLI